MKHKKGTFVIDKHYSLVYDKEYLPPRHFTIEDEIRSRCKKERIVIQSIKEMKYYSIIGRKVRSKKDYEALQKAINEL